MKKDFSQDDFLKILDKADRFTDWMYGEIKPFLKGDILELGSGFGTYSKKVINDFPNNKIVLSDMDEGRINKLKELQSSNVSVSKIDISDRKDFEKIRAPIDSALALNVLEHIEDDTSVLNNVYDILSPGGTFVILVPAHRFLFNCIDKDAGHYRRYTKKSVSESISKTGFKIRKMFYFNFISIFGWYLNGNILKNHMINESAMGLLNRLVPSLIFFEKYITRKSMGISLIVVLEK